MKQLDSNKFLNLALNTLEENPNTPMSVKEIWAYAEKRNWIKFLNSKAKEPIQILGSQMYMDHKSLFERVGSNPTKFVKLGTSYNEEIEVSPVAATKRRAYNAAERKLHPLLAKFIYNKFLAYPKTIFHETSTKKCHFKGEGKWLHPDMVAVKFPFVNWNKRELTTELSKELGCFPMIFYSFELKQELTPGTEEFKESFFQAVSNSTWANEGYIVAYEIDDDAMFLSELQRLSTLYGIGVIDLKNEQILFPAKEKKIIDLSTVDKLATKNKDFADFVNQTIADCNKRDFKVDTTFYDKSSE
jgi:hypothetical protein